MSTSSMAIAQAQKQVGDLKQHHCLIIGLGEMGRLAFQAAASARCAAHQPRQPYLPTRGGSGASSMATRRIAGKSWGRLWHRCDIVISATGATAAYHQRPEICRPCHGQTRPAAPSDPFGHRHPRVTSAPDVGQIEGVCIFGMLMN